jgi:hypothetical protein
MSLRTYPICISSPRRQPTLLGLIKQAELDLRTSTPRPQPRPVPPLGARTA